MGLIVKPKNSFISAARCAARAADRPNRHTERSHEYEGVARGLYQSQVDVTATQVGIILNHGIGYSPDSLIGEDGLYEIKTNCRNFRSR